MVVMMKEKRIVFFSFFIVFSLKHEINNFLTPNRNFNNRPFDKLIRASGKPCYWASTFLHLHALEGGWAKNNFTPLVLV